MFPSSLAGYEQVHVVPSENAGEEDEEETEHHEGHPDSLDMANHRCVVIVHLVSQRVAIICNAEAYHLDPRLEEQKQPELAMVELPYAAANPEAMVVELSNTLVAVMAVSSTVRLPDIAYLAVPFWRQLHRFFITNALDGLGRLEHACLLVMCCGRCV